MKIRHLSVFIITSFQSLAVIIAINFLALAHASDESLRVGFSAERFVHDPTMSFSEQRNKGLSTVMTQIQNSFNKLKDLNDNTAPNGNIEYSSSTVSVGSTNKERLDLAKWKTCIQRLEKTYQLWITESLNTKAASHTGLSLKQTRKIAILASKLNQDRFDGKKSNTAFGIICGVHLGNFAFKPNGPNEEIKFVKVLLKLIDDSPTKAKRFLGITSIAMSSEFSKGTKIFWNLILNQAIIDIIFHDQFKPTDEIAALVFLELESFANRAVSKNVKFTIHFEDKNVALRSLLSEGNEYMKGLDSK